MLRSSGRPQTFDKPARQASVYMGQHEMVTGDDVLLGFPASLFRMMACQQGPSTVPLEYKRSQLRCGVIPSLP
jgi:hypothetical protein